MDLGTFRNITVTKKPNGLFQARGRIRLKTGALKHMARTAGTEQEARNILFRALQDELGKVKTSRLDGDTLFEVVAERYLERIRRSKSEATHYMYRHHMDRCLLPNLGKLALSEITVLLLEDLFGELAESYAPASLRNIRAPLSGALGDAVRLESIPDNPVKKMQRISGGTARAQALTDDQIDTLLRVARKDTVAAAYDLPDFITFMLNTGCRVGEALALEWRNVDMMDSLLHIRHNLINIGKIEVRDGKTAAARRSFYMSDELFEVMLRRSTDRDLSSTSPVFASATGGYRSPHNVRRALRRLYQLPEIKAQFEWVKQPTHVFRKTVATRMRTSGVSDLEIADFLGHEDVSTTQKSYIDRTLPSRAAAAALNGITRRATA